MRADSSNAHVIVNEAAETPVDDALLGQSSRLSVLAGGCVCCTAKADLIALLRKLCDERSRDQSDAPRLEQIVLETSGLADPGPIVAAIKTDPVLVYHIVVSEIIVAVDALHALSQLQTEPLGRRQIEMADRLIVTKTDVAEEGACEDPAGDAAHAQPCGRNLRRIKGCRGAAAGFRWRAA